MPEREPLPPGILPNIFDTDPPPLNPATEVGDGYVRINQEKVTPPPAREAAVHHGSDRHPEPSATHHTTTVTVTRTATR